MKGRKKVVTNRKRFSFFPRHRIILSVFFVLGLLLLLLTVDLYVGSFSKGRLYYDINDVPHRRAALVLGCCKYAYGRPSPFYQYRINATVELWQSGKINAVLVSGDNSKKKYDEPGSMKFDLVARGIPAEYITLDCAGLRTLDSVIRANRIFGLEEYIIISQPFHCRRAVYLARKHNQQVICWCAHDVKNVHGLIVRLREILARNKAVFDILIHKKPKYLGKRERVNYKTESPDESVSQACSEEHLLLQRRVFFRVI